MNILIPMGGKGLRFQETGLSIPKPLIDVDGDTVISRVLDSLKLQGQFIYVHRQDHAETHLIDKIINKKQKPLSFWLPCLFSIFALFWSRRKVFSWYYR